MTPLAQLRAALEEIAILIEMIECSNKDNLALLPLFLEQLKRALAALARMEQPFEDKLRAVTAERDALKERLEDIRQDAMERDW